MANTEAGMHCDITGSQKLSYSFNRCAFVKSTCCLTAFFLTPWKRLNLYVVCSQFCFFFRSRLFENRLRQLHSQKKNDGTSGVLLTLQHRSVILGDLEQSHCLLKVGSLTLGWDWNEFASVDGSLCSVNTHLLLQSC